MGPEHTTYYEKLCKYVSTYSTNPKPTLLRVSRHVVENKWELVDVVAKLLIVSRMSEVDYQNKVLTNIQKWLKMTFCCPFEALSRVDESSVNFHQIFTYCVPWTTEIVWVWHNPRVSKSICVNHYLNIDTYVNTVWILFCSKVWTNILW